MGFLTKDKNCIDSEYFKMETDLPALNSHGVKPSMVNIILQDTYVDFKNPVGGQCVRLQYNQITDIEYGNVSEIKAKNKSTIGRAIVGGILFGGAGAVVGAITSTTKNGKKTKETFKKKFIISYTSSVTNKEAFLVFEDTRGYHGKRLADTLKKLVTEQVPSYELIPQNK